MEAPREPHLVSLKVLRLSRPSLLQNFPLPTTGSTSIENIDANKAADIRAGEIEEHFLLNPVLTLPPAFGNAYVGETFSCTLCANNELGLDAEKQVASVKISAEMITPSGTHPLETLPNDEESMSSALESGKSIQKIVRFDLREEGSHTLAVNLSYSETTISKDQSASSNRVRTFRKLYQFACRPCLNVRTKVSALPDNKENSLEKYVIEIQLDNLAEGTISLRKTTFHTKLPFKSTSLNWDLEDPSESQGESPVIAPRDVIQLAFLIEQQDDRRKEVTKDGRTILGQLSIQWQTTMGDSGFLTTGWLTTKRR